MYIQITEKGGKTHNILKSKFAKFKEVLNKEYSNSNKEAVEKAGGVYDVPELISVEAGFDLDAIKATYTHIDFGGADVKEITDEEHAKSLEPKEVKLTKAQEKEVEKAIEGRKAIESIKEAGNEKVRAVFGLDEEEQDAGKELSEEAKDDLFNSVVHLVAKDYIRSTNGAKAQSYPNLTTLLDKLIYVDGLKDRKSVREAAAKELAGK